MAKKNHDHNQIDNVRAYIKITSAATIALATHIWNSSEGRVGDWALCATLLFSGTFVYDGARDPANHLANLVLDLIEPPFFTKIIGEVDQSSE